MTYPGPSTPQPTRPESDLERARRRAPLDLPGWKAIRAALGREPMFAGPAPAPKS
jgi:hypothetical protein